MYVKDSGWFVDGGRKHKYLSVWSMYKLDILGHFMINEKFKQSHALMSITKQSEGQQGI